MAIKASCLCGAVSFEISRAVGPFEICHCSRCRKVSGSQGMAGIGVRTDEFRMLGGTGMIKSYTAPVIDKPPAYQVFFCSGCGSCVPDPDPQGDWFEIPAGLFDDPLQIVPDKHIYVEFIPDWDTISDELPRYTKAEIARHRKR